jgi:hypothetical protein
MGGQMDPSQAFAQRDAFVQSINAARSPFAEAVGSGYRGPPPQRDLGQLWSQAGDMVKGGWQNPLGYDAMIGRLASQAPGAQVGIAYGDITPDAIGRPLTPERQRLAQRGYIF